MARPFKETPILYGEDARRFQEAMDNVKPYSAEEKQKMFDNVKAFCSKLTYNCFERENAYNTAV